MGKQLANFEGLIRGAIAAKQASTPQQRLEVYQSSRNALYRLIEENRTLTIETAMQEQKALEDAIARIETEFTRIKGSVSAEQPAHYHDPADNISQSYEPRTTGFNDSQPASLAVRREPSTPLDHSSFEHAPEADLSTNDFESDYIPHQMPDATAGVAPAGPDEDPLAELKEILLEDADDTVRESFQVDDYDPVPAVEQEDAVQAIDHGDALPVVEHTNDHPAADQKADITVDEPVSDTASLDVEPAPIVVQNEAPQVDATPPVVEQQTVVSPEIPQTEVSSEVAPAVDSEAVVQPGQSPDAPGVPGSEQYDENENMPLEFARRRRKQKIVGWILTSVLVLALITWLAYYIYIGILNGTLFGLNNLKPAENPNAPSNQATAADYITIVEPGDLSALITSNRGQAELINELNLEMVRIVSVRDDVDRSEPAKPILLRLKPGVLEQISGKNVTFEIYAKSGSSSAAQFTVKCLFGTLGSCGRKRFRVGLQPEASIFAFDLRPITDPEAKAYIAISTDTTAVAATTGRGDVIDIVYARLRASN